MGVPQYATLHSIMTATNRTHFTQADGEVLISTLRGFGQAGRNLRPHSIMAGAVQESFQEGLIALRAEDLDTDFVLVKQNAGKGWFGGQKSRVLTYVGTISEDELMPSASVRNVLMAFASIGAVYKSQGF